MMTLIIDIFIPFTTISILNTILIRAIRQRSRELDSFGGGSASNTNAGKVRRVNRGPSEETLATIIKFP